MHCLPFNDIVFPLWFILDFQLDILEIWQTYKHRTVGFVQQKSVRYFGTTKKSNLTPEPTSICFLLDNLIRFDKQAPYSGSMVVPFSVNK